MKEEKQDHILSEGPMCHPPWRFMYLRETKSWRCEEEGGEEREEKVHMLTHANTRAHG